MAYIDEIVQRAWENTSFREVLGTAPHSQVVVMCIAAGDDIGAEVHADVDQILVVVDGHGEAVLDGERTQIEAGWLVQVPAGSRHDIVNTGDTDLRLYTIYAPPQHAPGTIHRTKADAEAAEAAEVAAAGAG